jgi:hypothetical protein
MSAATTKKTAASKEDAPEEAYEAPAQPKPAEDVQRLLPDPSAPVELANGSKVRIKSLKLREFLAMLKIVTRGAAMAMGSVRLDTNDEDFAQSLISLFLFAIPEAEEEAVDFIRLMVEPVGPFADGEREAAEAKLFEDLDNPELEDIVTIVEGVIQREGKDLRALGKRLSAMLEVAKKTGQVS